MIAVIHRYDKLIIYRQNVVYLRVKSVREYFAQFFCVHFRFSRFGGVQYGRFDSTG